MVTGFEPLDLLQAILMVIKQLKAKAENADCVLSIETNIVAFVPNEGNKLPKALSEVFMLKKPVNGVDWVNPMSGIQLHQLILSLMNYVLHPHHRKWQIIHNPLYGNRMMQTFRLPTLW